RAPRRHALGAQPPRLRRGRAPPPRQGRAVPRDGGAGRGAAAADRRVPRALGPRGEGDLLAAARPRRPSGLPADVNAGFLVLAVFRACAVEMVEATTIVLAGGVTRSWRSTLVGVGAAVVALAAVVGALGPTLTLVPLDALRLVVGSLLLAFGLQWLRK